MYQSRWRNRINSKGYSLIEALFHLVVFMLFTQFIALVFVWIQQLNSTLFTKEHVEWEMFVYDIKQYLEDVESIELIPKTKGIEIKTPQSIQKRQITQLADVIRMQSDKDGHVPLLIGIQQVDFVLNGDELTIKVEFRNGILKERTFFVQFYQE